MPEYDQEKLTSFASDLASLITRGALKSGVYLMTRDVPSTSLDPKRSSAMAEGSPRLTDSLRATKAEGDEEQLHRPNGLVDGQQATNGSSRAEQPTLSSDHVTAHERSVTDTSVPHEDSAENEILLEDEQLGMLGHAETLEEEQCESKKHRFFLGVRKKLTPSSSTSSDPDRSSSVSNLRRRVAKILNLNREHHHQSSLPEVRPKKTVLGALKRRKRKSKSIQRALPPVPTTTATERTETSEEEDVFFRAMEDITPGTAFFPDDEEGVENIFEKRQTNGAIDFTTSLEKVKECSWYWGPISGETAERLLLTEPDGSFVVRDSSDDHYIFSLTFKLNGTVRHVRIEHDQGNFSFGSYTKFKSNTIVDFIENAVEHSRSGRYLFFLHRQPVLGPMRVQLLHPVSRFKKIQSLQHLCRFVILKNVPRDLLDQLPIPPRVREYLNTPYYYCESIPVAENSEDKRSSHSDEAELSQ